MNKVLIEVCIDSPESLEAAIVGGAGRIELCSALELGGLSPSYGFTQYALEHCDLPIFAMVRPRSGDFLYSAAEQQVMFNEISQYKRLGVAGIVIGALNADASIATEFLAKCRQLAPELEFTFHRAIDLVADPEQALEAVINLGFQHLLSSGQQPTAEQGITQLQAWVKQAKGRISIMPGCGVNLLNAKNILEQTGVHEIHLSASVNKASAMQVQAQNLSMGSQEDPQQLIKVCSSEVLQALSSSLLN